MKYDTVIFDLDGTLLDTLDDLADAVNHALRRMGYPERSLKEIRCFLGNGAARLMKLSVPDNTDDSDFEEALGYFKEYYYVHCNDKTHLYRGIEEMIGRLKEFGVKIAIVSNKPDHAVKELKALYFADMIDVAIGESRGVARKPAPDTVMQALKELKSLKENAVYVGDSEVDIETAVNSGIPCISVDWGFRDRDALVRSGATCIVNTPEEIAEIILEG